MARAALAALTLAAAVAAAAAPDPCCLRVTPYHIQALAQRMAQRFQALEYRAQDLRYVFASFQAVHGNVSHRLRYLEAEHAHLGQLVGRLDARVQALEAEKHMEQYRQQVAYYSRGPRHSPVRTPVDELVKPPRRPPFVMRRRRNENQTELPHLFIHLDQSKESFEEVGNISFTKETTSSTDTAADRPSSETSPAQLTSPAPELAYQIPNVQFEAAATVSGDSAAPELAYQIPNVQFEAAATVSGDSAAPELAHQNPNVHFDAAATVSGDSAAPELAHRNPNVHSEAAATVSGHSERRPTPHSPVFLDAASQAPPQLRPDAPASDSVTTPTPLWQLEETASALLDVMSAGDDDPDAPAGIADDTVSYWSPANESDSLEELFNPLHKRPAPGTAKCTDQTNCGEEKPAEQSTGEVSNISTTTDATVSDSGSANSVNSSSDSGLSQHDADALPNMAIASGNGSVNTSSERETSDVPAVKTSGCKTPNSALPVGETPIPSDNATNLTRLLLDMGNDTSSLADLLFSPYGGGGSGGGAAPTCGPEGCGGGSEGGGSAELSDAELQAALRELDALLQRPPASAQPPDPEKVLLKRALTLALAALERTSDACLKLVNFTADAFEGMAATEA